jgi:hypothetical protein
MDGEYLGSNRLKVIIFSIFDYNYTFAFNCQVIHLPNKMCNLSFNATFSWDLEKVCLRPVFGWMDWHQTPQNSFLRVISAAMDMLPR